jgi:hypothetical protein
MEKVFRNVTKSFWLEGIPRHDLSNGKRACNMGLTGLCTVFLIEMGRGSGNGIELPHIELVLEILNTGMNLRGVFFNARNFCTR